MDNTQPNLMTTITDRYLIADGRYDGLEGREDAAQSQGDEHQEEDGGEDVANDTRSKESDNFRINHERESGSALKFKDSC